MKCPYCQGLGHDASGFECSCTGTKPQHLRDLAKWLLIVLVMLAFSAASVGVPHA